MCEKDVELAQPRKPSSTLCVCVFVFMPWIYEKSSEQHIEPVIFQGDSNA